MLNNSTKPSDEINDSGFITRVRNTRIDSPNENKFNVEQQQQNDGKVLYRQMRSRTQLFGNISSDNAKEPFQQPPPAAAPSVIHSEVLKIPNTSARKPFGDSRISLSTYRSTFANEEIKETPLKGSSKEQFNFVTPSTRPLQSSLIGSHQQSKIIFRTPKVEVTPLSSVTKRLSPLRENPTKSIDENVLIIKNIEYLIDKKIGFGGSSMVFLAKGKKTGTEVAIKVVNLDGDEQMVEGYLNETKLLDRLQGNVNVVKLYDYCHQPEKKTLYMVMEKGDSDLHRILQEFRDNIPLYTLMSYWYQMLQAVSYIHQNGVIHSDLKPANFLMIGGRLKLIDFGIASNISCDSTSIIKFSQAGTFNYISPEALTDTSSDNSPMHGNQPKIRLSTRSDVWSLGCILYLLIYKKTPFSHIKLLPSKISAITNPKTIIEYPELPSYYPPILIEMLKRCLVHNPKQRATCADLLTYPFDMVIPIDKQ